jgi:hypothetical protein
VLLRVADRLRREVGDPAAEETPGEGLIRGEGNLQAAALEPEDELLVAKVRRELARIACALTGDNGTEAQRPLLVAALDGAEMTMRGELMRGHHERLPALLPGFVFLVALPIVDRNEAYELSRRTLELVDEAGREV